MPIVKRLTPLGGSSAVILPKPFLDQLGIDPDHQEVELAMDGDRIVVTAHRYATQAEFRRAAAHVFTKHRKSLERLAKR
jgi:antitoxin component of MazEF toxin-antitoxin module